MNTERKPIPGFERYEMDTAGNVYAMFPHHGIPAGRTIKSRVNPDGYVTVTLTREGRGLIRTIHRLLMLTFCPVENSRQLEVNHKDGNRSNNNISNLEWKTHTENMLHSHLVLNSWSNMPRGERASGHKLTENNVREIRRSAASGIPRKDLAQQFNVSHVAIGHILTGKSWRHVE